MALRDLIETAMNEAGDAARRAILAEVLDTAGSGGGDAEILAALSKVITEHELKAGTYTQARQTETAAQEREHIDALRVFLRQAAESAPAKPVKPKKVKPAAKPAQDAEAQQKDPGKSAFNRLQIAIVVLVCVLLAVAFAAWKLMGTAGDTGGDLQNASSKAITHFAEDMTEGDKSAPVTLLEYAAPSCPHCAHFNDTVFPLLKKNYIDTGKVFYIYRTFPIMPADAAVEAIARRCFPADKYFRFLDLMFRNQEKWDPEYDITDVRGGILKVTRIAGLSTQQVDQCMSDASVKDLINRMSEDAVKKYDLHGTPAFVINGTLWRAGGTNWEELKEKLDSVLAGK